MGSNKTNRPSPGTPDEAFYHITWQLESIRVTWHSKRRDSTFILINDISFQTVYIIIYRFVLTNFLHTYVT